MTKEMQRERVDSHVQFEDPSIKPITEEEFLKFQALVQREAGIFLSPLKKTLLVVRLTRRLHELNMPSFSDYHRFVTGRGGSQELMRMVDCICTNETHFFRETRHFEFLEEHVFPQWKERAVEGAMQKRIRVWSAGCSTGEEPYSLAMVLLHEFQPASGWQIEILASDLSNQALERARAAIWPIEKSEEIPEKYLKAFMLKGVGTQNGKMKAGPEIRSLVKFTRINLIEDGMPGLGMFDAIFCRNVLIYFKPETKEKVVCNLLDHLSPNGYIFLGHSETLTGLVAKVRSVIPSVYECPKGRESTGPLKGDTGSLRRKSGPLSGAQVVLARDE